MTKTRMHTARFTWKKMSCLAVAAALALSVTACGSSAAQDQTGAASAGTEQSAATSNETRLLGQISAIDGNSITIALAEQPERNPDSGNGGARPKDADSAPTGEAPDEAGTPPAGQAANGAGTPPQGEMPDRELTLTGETLTVEVTDSVSITVNGDDAARTDLAVDDIVTVVKDGDTVVAIQSGAPAMGGQPRE